MQGSARKFFQKFALKNAASHRFYFLFSILSSLKQNKNAHREKSSFLTISKQKRRIKYKIHELKDNNIM